MEVRPDVVAVYRSEDFPWSEGNPDATVEPAAETEDSAVDLSQAIDLLPACKTMLRQAMVIIEQFPAR